MGKALGPILIGAVIIGAAFLTGGASLIPTITASASLTGPAILATTALSTTFLGGLALSFGAAEILSGIGQLTAKKGGGAGVSPITLSRLNASLNPSAPRPMVFGHTAMATDIRYVEPSGTNQEYIDYIIAVASHKVTSIEEIWLEDALAWTSAGGVQGVYSGFLTVATILEGSSSAYHTVNGGTHWGSAQRLTGCASIHLIIKRSGTNSPFTGGLPSRMTVIGKGIPLYDPRLDSTVPGGSGTMRANDQTTWSYAPGGTEIGQNLALQSLAYLLGWRINGKIAVGSGLPPARLDLAGFITAANLCDETVTTSTGSQPRYHGAGLTSEADDPSSVLTTFATTCNGRFREALGKLALIVMHNDLALATSDAGLGDDEMIGGFTWNPDPSLEQTYNVVRGRFTDPSTASLYQLVDYPEVRLTSVDGIDRIMPLDLPWVQDAAMAQRLAKQVLERKQYQRTLSAVWNMAGWTYKVGDLVPVTLSALGFSRRLFRVEQQIAGFDGTCPMILTEENAAIYAWDASDVAPVTAAAPIVYNPLNNPLLQAINANAGTNAWTPALNGWTRSGTNFIKGSGTGWVNSVRSVEAFTNAYMSAVITENHTDTVVGLLDPATGQRWVMYLYGTDGGGNGRIYMSHFAGEIGASTETDGSSFTSAAGMTLAVAFVGDLLHGFINGADVGAMPNTGSITAATPLKLNIQSSQAATEVDSVIFGRSGSAGTAGYTSQVITLYKRSATSPAVPTNDCTYTFATQAFSPAPNNGWTQGVPTADGNPLWAIAATAYANTATDAIAHGEWSTPVTITADGLTVATVFLFQRSATSPSGPSGALTYTFASGALTPSGNLNGWSTTVPGGTNPLWIIQATAGAPATLPTDGIGTAEWSTPVIHAQNGTDGANGGNTAIVTLYQRSSGTPTVPSNDTTYTFATGGLSPAPNNSWSTTIPAVNGNPLWVTQAAAFASGTTDAISHTEWSSPVQLVQDGAAGTGSPGSNGLNSAIVFLYQRATSAPSVPGGTLTYTFATGVLSGTLGSWTQTIPAGTNPIYVIQATASATGTNDTIATGEWSSPNILAQNGSNGSNGATGIGTTALSVVGTGVTWDGVTLDCSTDAGGSFTNSGAWSNTPIAGGVTLSVISPHFYTGSSTDVVIGLRSAPGSSFSVFACDLGAFRFADYNTGAPTSGVHYECFQGGGGYATGSAPTGVWNPAYTYQMRYDAKAGITYFLQIDTSGAVTTLATYAAGANKPAGIQATFGKKGRITNIAFGASGSDGSSNSVPQAIVAGDDIVVGAGKSIQITVSDRYTSASPGGSAYIQLQSRLKGGSFTVYADSSATPVSFGTGDSYSVKGVFTFVNSAAFDQVYNFQWSTVGATGFNDANKSSLRITG